MFVGDRLPATDGPGPVPGSAAAGEVSSRGAAPCQANPFRRQSLPPAWMCATAAMRYLSTMERAVHAEREPAMPGTDRSCTLIQLLQSRPLLTDLVWQQGKAAGGCGSLWARGPMGASNRIAGGERASQGPLFVGDRVPAAPLWHPRAPPQMRFRPARPAPRPRAQQSPPLYSDVRQDGNAQGCTGAP